jgi:single-stranded-DNA-specific exonuclease
VKNNELRKNINISDFDKAINDLKGVDISNTFSIFVSGDYHIGVAGIVASNLVEKYKKPSIVLCKSQDGIYRGSARSVPGIDLHLALEECSELLLGFGGHKMAGGMTIDREYLSEFRMIFDKMICKQSSGKLEDSAAQIDADIEIPNLFKSSILRQLHLFEPFGQGNPQLIFRDTTASLYDITPIGKDKNHLRLSFGSNGQGVNTRIKGIAFGFGAYADDCRIRKEKEILYTTSMNCFRGKRNWQVRVTDIVFPNL